MIVIFEVAGPVVQGDAVQVADAHDDLKRVSQVVSANETHRDGYAERAPDKLPQEDMVSTR